MEQISTHYIEATSIRHVKPASPILSKLYRLQKLTMQANSLSSKYQFTFLDTFLELRPTSVWYGQSQVSLGPTWLKSIIGQSKEIKANFDGFLMSKQIFIVWKSQRINILPGLMSDVH